VVDTSAQDTILFPTGMIKPLTIKSESLPLHDPNLVRSTYFHDINLTIIILSPRLLNLLLSEENTR